MKKDEMQNLLMEINKNLAIVVTDVSYIKDGHSENKKKINEIEKIVVDINSKLIEGEGKIHRNWDKACDVETKLHACQDEHAKKLETARDTGFRAIDILFSVVLIILSIISIFR